MIDSKPKYTCQVCGAEAYAEVIAQLVDQFGRTPWYVHSIERRGGVIQVLACPGCATLSQDMILESYKERIRLGLVLGFH